MNPEPHEPKDLWLSEELLDSLPIEVESDLDISLYDSADADLRPIAARIPDRWLRIIDLLRQTPDSPLQNLFPTRSDFVRWAIQLGIKTLQKRIADSGLEQNPLISAHIFIERVSSQSSLRSTLIQKVVKDTEEVAKAVRRLMQYEQHREASNLITEYVDEAMKHPNEFWREWFILALLHHKALVTDISTLITDGALVSDVLERALEDNRASDVEAKDND